MKLQKTDNHQYFLTLPSSLMKAMGWNKGDDVKVEVMQKDVLTLKRVGG